MKKWEIKITSGALSGMLLLGTMIVPLQSAFAASPGVTVQENDDVLFTDDEMQSMEEFFMNYDEDEFYFWKLQYMRLNLNLYIQVLQTNY